MAINFKNIAKRKTLLSDIMDGRTKVEKEDGIVEILDFDIVPNPKGEAYAVCAINDSQFINGGQILTDIFTEIVKEVGDKEEARKQFRDAGGFKVNLKKDKTSTGRNITRVEVIDD